MWKRNNGGREGERDHLIVTMVFLFFVSASDQDGGDDDDDDADEHMNSDEDGKEDVYDDADGRDDNDKDDYVKSNTNLIRIMMMRVVIMIKSIMMKVKQHNQNVLIIGNTYNSSNASISTTATSYIDMISNIILADTC